MATVIHMQAHRRATAPSASSVDFTSCFAQTRRSENDVFWLKENAELLNILECTGQNESNISLSVYDSFYNGIERRICFFRQYYRFLLSICLDLEELGMPGEKGEMLTHWVAQQKLPLAELSDLQRAEAERLLNRRNVGVRDPGLSDRLRAFVANEKVFALPNTKIAYELTHIVFYLSEYGRKDPLLPDQARQSLINTGLVAYLDQNMDLLAEICIALRFANVTPPEVWENCLARSLRAYQFEAHGFDGTHDDYHTYFVGSWWSMLRGTQGFTHSLPGPATAIWSDAGSSALKALSVLIYENEQMAARPWQMVRGQVLDHLAPQERRVVMDAETCVADFNRFYSVFGRAGFAG